MSKLGPEEQESSSSASAAASSDLRRGPWTLDEDNLLIHYVTCNGEGRWNTLAKSAGLKRTGKSCRLRWLNYLKPDIKRGNLSPQEQLLILELHSKWGNRWSKIAQHLPGRTDNEIKNYWRTRVQKQARQLNVDSNSNKFLEAIRRYWMPRLLEKAEHNTTSTSTSTSIIDTTNQESAPPSVPNQPPIVAPEKTMEESQVKAEKQGSPVTLVPQFCDKSNECYQVDMTQVFPNDEELMSLSNDWFKDEMPLAYPLPENSLWNMDELWHFRKPEVGM